MTEANGSIVPRRAGATSVRIVIIAAGARDSTNILPSARHLTEQGMDVDIHCADSGDLDSDEGSFVDMMKLVADAHLVVVRLHNDTSHFKKWDRFRETAEKAAGLVFVDSPMPEVRAEVRPLFRGVHEKYDLLTAYVELVHRS